MQARIARVGEIVVVHLNGRVDVETAEPFRKACNEFLIKEKVVFDFQALGFVGSSGILPFLETLQTFAEKTANRFKFCGVGSEFKKVFAATSLSTIEIYDTHQQAVHAFVYPPPQYAQQAMNGAVQAVPQVATPVQTNATQSMAAPGASMLQGQPHSGMTSGQALGASNGMSAQSLVQPAPESGFGMLSFRPDDEV